MVSSDGATGLTWLAPILETLEPVHGRLELDPWAPKVQGAAGQVVGVRAADLTPYVLKAYTRVGGRQAATEALALDLLRDVSGIPVPRVVDHAQRGLGVPRPYVLMTRLPGVRWADRRYEVDDRAVLAVHREMGRLLRRLHVLPGEAFGDLLPDGRRWTTAWSRVDARCTELVRGFVDAGGVVGLGRAVRDLVESHRDELRSSWEPVLCHNDFIDGNLLVEASGTPVLTGVVDLERASWDDPMTDLARTRFQARFHDEVAADALIKAYGLRSEDEERRLAVHEVLHAVQERTWVATDRPNGWRQSVARLDGFLRSRT